MNYRKWIYFSLWRLKHNPTPDFYEDFFNQDLRRCAQNELFPSVVRLLDHCKNHVAYYSHFILNSKSSYKDNPFEFLKSFPILTKDIIRANFQDLQSKDLASRKWYYNTSGGSTGEPVRLIQDKGYSNPSYAISELYSRWIGREIGEPQIILWGSERDILENSKDWINIILNSLANNTFQNAFKMSTTNMRRYLSQINSIRPKLILAYAQSIYELACFAERESIHITPQQAIITSAGTLYDFMRQKIENIFKCRVYNRYGSREVGQIAAERPGYHGLMVPPWGNYIEIVDEIGNPVPHGIEGNVVVTNLLNYAMPLIRYKIGDRAVQMDNDNEYGYQRLLKVSGRNVDSFIKPDGEIIDGEFFTHLLYFRDWVQKFQVVQIDYMHILYRIQPTNNQNISSELKEIEVKTKKIMGEKCRVNFELVDEIHPSPSGKYRYTISEIKRL